MTAALLGACSSDVTRFGDDPFASPFKSRAAFDPVATNSINRPKAPAATQGSMDTATTQALPPPSQPLPGSNAPRASAPLTTGSVGTSNYPPLANAAPRQPAVVGSAAGWTAVGGTPVTLQQGESLNTLSSRYGVPVNALMAVNGFSNVNQARPGQQIMIPAYNAVPGAKSAAGAPSAGSVIQRPQPVAQPMPPAIPQSAAMVPPRAVQPAAAAPVKVAANARQVSPAPVSDAEKRAAAKLKEMKAPKPASKTEDDEDEKSSALARKKAEAAKAAEAKAKLEAENAKAAKIIASRKARTEDDNVTTASISNAMPAAKAPAKPEPEKEAAATTGDAESASFRWPAKGRVITGFGARGTGGANEGINIALPEGTPVRAAEGGTVVHADDALKGYGKLVLIRHPNGYVSVYAHNGELNVKRGESVKRGQLIAKSGQTGNVTAPQLHFEIRKGATPVDPTKYLGE